jgi:hypothetical protein
MPPPKSTTRKKKKIDLKGKGKQPQQEQPTLEEEETGGMWVDEFGPTCKVSCTLSLYISF